MTKKPQIGDYVQLWADAADYGKVIKLNKKTFVVAHNRSGRTLYKYDAHQSNPYLYKCTKELFSCTLLLVGTAQHAHAVKHYYPDNIHDQELRT
jgi:hypothetical protein